MSTNIIVILIIIHLINKCKASIHPQYGFAHRVNDPDQINSVLKHGGNAIEIDVCYGRNTDQIQDWYVSHSDLNVCHNKDAVLLTSWLIHFKCLLLNNPSYINQFAMLWLDIKDPTEFKLNQVPKIVQSIGFPPNIKILYDLTGFNSDSKIGFEQIAPRLHRNEGITFCAGKSCKGDQNTVREIYEYYKFHRFWRGTFNTGDSVNIDENFLIWANSKNFNEAADPFRFKSVFSWTHNKEDEIRAQINPSNKYHSDGQIFGDWTSLWKNDERYIKMFSDSINRYNSRERFATSYDNPFVEYNRHYDYDELGFLVDRNGNSIDIIKSSYIALKSFAYNKYVTVYSDGSMNVSGDEITRFEKFVLYETSKVNYILHLMGNYYISALNSNGYAVEATAKWPFSGERWKIVNTAYHGINETFALESYHEKYLTAYSDGRLDAAANSIGEEQKFEIVPWLSWLEPGEDNFTSTDDTNVYPTMVPTECPTIWPTEALTKEERAWFISGVVFICFTSVSLMIVCCMGYLIHEKNKEKRKGDKLGTYKRTIYGATTDEKKELEVSYSGDIKKVGYSGDIKR